MKTDMMSATTNDRGAERAARAIVALINSRPSSPRQQEIEELIEKYVPHAARLVRSTPSGLDEYGPDLTTYRP
jgi:hypothetical protein